MFDIDYVLQIDATTSRQKSICYMVDAAQISWNNHLIDKHTFKRDNCNIHVNCTESYLWRATEPIWPQV